MKKILYVIRSHAHKRVFESFKPKDGLDQLLVGPEIQVTTNLVPEDYSDFKIKTKLYKDIRHLQKMVNSFNPDIAVQCSTYKDISYPVSCKKVFVSHGLAGNNIEVIKKKNNFIGFDLYCGDKDLFADWIVPSARTTREKVLQNAVPQLDLLHDGSYYNSYKERVVSFTKNPTAKRVILFCGFCCKDRPDFDLHNEDYFKTAIELEKIAKKHNWLILIKPRQPFGRIISFLKTHNWGKKYVQPYSAIQSSKYLHFISTNAHIYRYFFADLFICNGYSTTEIETCLVNKPLILVRTRVDAKNYDPFDTVTSGAGTQVKDINKLEEMIIKVIDKTDHIDKQNALLNDLKIKNDGKAYLRVQEALEKL